jgi:hypothetical protein
LDAAAALDATLERSDLNTEVLITHGSPKADSLAIEHSFSNRYREGPTSCRRSFSALLCLQSDRNSRRVKMRALVAFGDRRNERERLEQIPGS